MPKNQPTRFAIHSCLASFLFFSLIGLAGCSNATTIVLDGAGKGKTYEGIGALSAGASSRLLYDYQEPYRSQILDYLFKPGYGAALQHLKVEIGADVNSTDGSEPSSMRSRDDHDYNRGYEWWLMEEARKRNPQIILDSLPWGAPGWVGNGHFYSQDMASYVADFLQGAERYHHLDIAYTGIWNERQFDSGYVKMLYHTLAQQGIPAKIVCCDEYPGEGLGQWSIVDTILKDPEVNAAVYAVGVHYSLVDGKYTTPPNARTLNKPLWSSEDQPNSGGGPILSRDWPIGGRILARLYNRNYLQGGFTKTEIWSPITSYYDILAAPNSGLMYANTPWSGYYDVQGAIWATAHTTQFAQPGWQYLDAASGLLPEQGSYVSLKSPNGKDWSVVVETIDAKQPQKITLSTRGGLSFGTIHVWETNNQRTFEHVADLSPSGGRITVTLDPDSLYTFTTTTGQGRGTATPPANTPFPLPYADDFERTDIGHAPLFLSDQDGAFEAHPCLHRKGRCLEQVITVKPIPWSPLPDPFTLAGDVTWTNYRVAADILPTADGSVTLMGRIDSADVFKDHKALYPSGYVLSLEPGGKWTLLASAYKTPTRTLASGSVRMPAGTWHHAELGFKANQISVYLDGKELAKATDNSHSHGMFALGTAWNRAQFDNLTVAPQ
ncbi:MAG TPA: family 16 glycoside hydrolase [Acidobacteriaceae bacterium]|nr:family 16 glycoside hydrolase [Acidobacteriaceae bacterium]